MTNAWLDDEFVKEYATLVRNNSDWFEHDENQKSLLGIIPVSAKTVLDYGCASGNFANILSDKYEVSGYDISVTARKIARQQFPTLRIMDSVTGEFDCITLKLVLHFIDDAEEFLHNLAEHLTENGSFVVSIPHPVRAYLKNKIPYGSVGKFSYNYEIFDKEVLNTKMIGRPLKYWIDTFMKLGFVMTAIDEPYKNGENLPKAFNARFEKYKSPDSTDDL